MAAHLRVWIASLPATEQGLSYRNDPEAPLRHAKRKKMVLNSVALEMPEMKAVSDLQFSEYPPNAIYGWALVQPALICHHLRDLTDGQKVQRRFWEAIGPGELQSIFFSDIIEVHELEHPVQMHDWATPSGAVTVSPGRPSINVLLRNCAGLMW